MHFCVRTGAMSREKETLPAVAEFTGRETEKTSNTPQNRALGFRHIRPSAVPGPNHLNYIGIFVDLQTGLVRLLASSAVIFCASFAVIFLDSDSHRGIPWRSD